MIKTKYFKRILLISIFMISCVYINPALFSSKDTLDTPLSDNFNDTEDIPKQNAIGDDLWWDITYHSRQLINITNPYSETLYNYGVSISFNYSERVDEGNMKSDLGDIRIIEYDDSGEAFQRKYYFQKDYPETDIVTVWFETNVTVNNGDSQLDTYLYYGNDDEEIDETYFMNKTEAGVADNFGWIRNGNFELDIESGPKITDIYGWNYADDVPSDVNGDTNYIPIDVTPDDYQYNLTNTAISQELIPEGEYAFKFGDIAHSVATGGIGDDLAGTLFSNPFVVPIVSGGSNKIYVNAWRNFRTYDKQQAKAFGIYVRICENYDVDVDSHVPYGKTVYTEGYVESWETYASETTLETWVKDPDGVLPDQSTSAGHLTGDLLIDVTDYQGESIFLEFGMYDYAGEKAGFAAFCQVDNVTFTYDLDVFLETEVERRKSDVSIIVKDVDGRIVPNAEVSIINSSKPIAEQIVYGPKNSSEDEGTALFTGVSYGDYYDITVNYTIPNTNFESVVYDSSIIGGRDFNLTETQHTFNITIDIWAIDFEIVDYDEEPLNYGYIAVYNNTKGDINLVNLTLDVNGKTTFRWKIQSSYYYEVYYDNIDYNLNPTLLNESLILRDTYEQIDKLREHNFNINQINKNATVDNYFSALQRIYTDGSLTELGNKKINNAIINVTLTGAEETGTFDSIRIFYIDENNSTSGNLIYSNDSYVITDRSDIFEIDMRSPPITSSNLKGDSYEVYGLFIEVKGQNTTTCSGIIEIDLTETCNIYNVTDLCKVDVKIIDSVGAGVAGCLVKVNGTNRDGEFSVELLTLDFTGYAYGQINTEISLWYLKGYNYTFSLDFFGAHKDLIVNETDKWEPSGNRYSYDYRLTQPANLTFEVYLGEGVNTSWYQTGFEDLTVVEQVIWSENVTVTANFTLTTDNWVTSEPITDPDEVFCTVKSTGIGSKVYLTLEMKPGVGAGIYSITFNSSSLSAGFDGKIYTITISGSKTGYSDPNDESESIFIDAVSTNLTMHDYYDSLIEISDFSQTFGEYINLTVKYYNNINSPLKGATLSYEWLSMDSVLFYEDPNNEGYYTATINTTIAEIWGVKSIKVIASLENYSTQTLITSINIGKRPTTLNGEIDLVYISTKVWVEDSHNFTYEYKDSITGNLTGDLDAAIYAWQKLDEYGEPISGIDGTGDLTQNENKVYTLDFKTGLKSIGFYFLYVNLYKQNYEERAALINLEIMYREFEVELNTTHLDGNQISVAQGDDVEFVLSLTDLTRNNISLEGASVVLDINNVAYTLTESSPGAYTLNFSTAEIDTYFAPQPLTGVLTIRKANFTSQEMTITIIVQMEEIFPGMPAFYFILITASIIGVAGSLIAYRVVQQARIPKFVKKIRKVKGKIKSKKPISESYAIKTKEQMMLKLFEEDWKALDLSLEDMLGTRDLKLKTNSLKEKKSKIGGDRD